MGEKNASSLRYKQFIHEPVLKSSTNSLLTVAKYPERQERSFSS